VPAAHKLQWLREWQRFPDAPAAVVEGAPRQRRAVFETCRRGFLLGNYEQLVRGARSFARGRRTSSCSTKRNGSRTRRRRPPSPWSAWIRRTVSC